ncbi:MAG: RHS repeat-associated core domain-containing protein [Candidatus Omnitrophota bacterium]
MKRIFKKSIASFLIAGFLLNTALPINKASAMTAPWWSGSQATGTTAVAAPPPSGNPNDNRKNQEQKGDPVSVHNGDFVYQNNDISIPSRAIPTEIKRTYKSQSRYNNRFGYGWDISYNKKIISLCNGDLYYLNAELNRYRFIYVDGTNYISPKGVYDKIVQNPDGTYTLTDQHGTASQFDQNGLLTEIKDRNNNSLHFSYEAGGKLPIIGKSVFSNDPIPKVIAYDYKLIKIIDTAAREITLNYNANGKLETIVDFSARTYAYAYDSLGNGDLISFTTPATASYPSGLTTTYTYTEHNLTSITDAKGATYLTNHYDQNDRVSRQEYGANTFTFFYESASSRTTLTDSKGFVTEWAYNADGNPTSKKEYSSNLRPTDPSFYLTTYQHNTNLERTAVTFPEGNGIKYTYDDGSLQQRNRGNLMEIRQKPDLAQADDDLIDLVTTFTYENTFNQITSVKDPQGRTTTYTYDPKGNLTKITYPTVGTVTPEVSFTYNAYGQIETTTDANSNVTKYIYEPLTGYLKQVINDFGTGKLNYTTEMGYDAVGNVTSIKDPKANTTAFSYNSLNQLTQTTSPAPFNYLTKYSYDQNGNLTKLERQADAGATIWQTTEYTYTILDQLQTIKDNLNNITTFTYDKNGNKASVKDAEDNTTSYTYDERNLLWKVTDALNKTTEYSYDKNSNLKEIKDAKSNLTAYTYDNFDRLTNTTYPDSSIEGYTYDKNSNLTAKTTPKNQTIYYDYDTLNRLAEKGLSPKGTVPESVVTYAYDAGSRLTSVIASQPQAGEAISYTYDAVNRVTQVITQGLTPQGPVPVNYEYDANSNRTKLTYPDATYITYEYDQLNRLTSVIASDSEAISTYTYDTLSRRTQTDLANNTQAIYQYDDINRLTSLMNKINAGSNISSSTYPAYDKVGNRLSMTTQEGTHNYTYDNIYQLKTVDYPVASSFTDTTFNYDSTGNRTSTVNGGTTNYTSNSLNQYTQVKATSYTYDNNGNLTSDGANTYTYDYENRLTNVVIASPQGEAIYKYDPFGRRIKRGLTPQGPVPDLFFIYDGDQIIAEYDSSGTLIAKYVYGSGIDEPIKMEKGGTSYYYHYDGLGSVTNLTDSSGATVETYSYDAFGKPSIASSIGNRFMFTGREYDSETGLYHYRARAYSPTLGRFLQRDPIGYWDSFNLYQYCRDNPVNSIDPLGLWVAIGEKPIGPGSHTVIILHPDNESDFKNNKSIPWYKNSKGEREATLSANPNWRPNLDSLYGNLTAYPSNKSDRPSKLKNIQRIQDPLGRSDTQLIKAIINSANKYQNNLPYDPVPAVEDPSVPQPYNSNSYTRGILKDAGIPNPPNLPGGQPGWDMPIPLGED